MITPAQARAIRAAAHLILQLVPDPDARIHARDANDHKRGLCHRAGNNPRLTDDPRIVDCKACKRSLSWAPWKWQRQAGSAL